MERVGHREGGVEWYEKYCSFIKFSKEKEISKQIKRKVVYNTKPCDSLVNCETLKKSRIKKFQIQVTCAAFL